MQYERDRCFLCGRADVPTGPTQEQDQDNFQIKCPDCGKFKVTGMVKEVMKIDSEDLAKVRDLFRKVIADSETPPLLTDVLWNELTQKSADE